MKRRTIRHAIMSEADRRAEIRSRDGHEPVPASDRDARTAGPTVTIHARNLHNPSHLEWTHDGRLLVSEHTAGRITDVTEGGDMSEAEPFATGLRSPASIEPVPDGRLLVSDTWGDRIVDVTGGGEVTADDTYASELQNPYSLCRVYANDQHRLYTTENLSGRKNVVTEVTGGGPASENDRVVNGIHSVPTAPGVSPRPEADWTERFDDSTAWQNQWHQYASGGCTDDWITDASGRTFLKTRAFGHITELTDVDPTGQPVDYRTLIERGNVVARDLGSVGGIKYNPVDGFIYGAKPESGELFRVDPDGPAEQRFNPPLVSGLSRPSCLRVGPDSETLYACDQADGVIWKISDFA